MIRLALLAGMMLFASQLFSQNTIQIGPDLSLVRVGEHTWVHTSWHTSPTFGRFSSNGVIVADSGKAALFDTPMNDSITKELVSFIQDTLKLVLVSFIPNHFHNDCTEGIDVLKSLNIPTFAFRKTDSLLKASGTPSADSTFNEDYRLKIGSVEVQCMYEGAAHTVDNIVTYIPSDKVLFAGCMCKSADSQNLGNTADADILAWPTTIRRVKEKYAEAATVIPGHGLPSDHRALDRTLELLAR